MAERLKQPSSINNYRKRLDAFFRFLAARGLLRSDLLANVRVRPVPRRERQRLSAVELLHLIEEAPSPRDRAYLAINTNTGLRANEIVALRVHDVRLDEGYLHVVISKTAEEDEMPITAELDRELRRWLVAYQEALGGSLDPSGYLIPASTGPRYAYEVGSDGLRTKVSWPGTWNPARPVHNPAQIVKHGLERLGLQSQWEGSHTVRRSVARIYFDARCEEGYDAALRATAALLHHKSVSTTEMYLGLTPERRKRDDTLRGRPFPTTRIGTEGVVRLRTGSDGTGR